MNIMNNTKTNRIRKTAMGIGLCLSIAFSGSMLLAAQPVHAATMSTNTTADNVIATGKQFLGVPYKFGAPAGRTDEFDCSSFVQYVFKQNGIKLPRSSRQQSKVGTVVSKDQLQPGDLIFSDTNRDGVINHVMIYMGNGQILHTYRVGIGVTISDFKGSAWDRTFVTARRVIPGSGQAPADNSGQAPADNGGQAPADNGGQAPADTTSPDAGQTQPVYAAPLHKQKNTIDPWEFLKNYGF